MGEMQNIVKDVDMQIVHRRLEARKRNISNAGKLSKRQLASAYRGFHGLEHQYHAMQHMSNEAMLQTKTVNDHLVKRHMEDIKHMIETQKTNEEQSDKQIKNMRDDFTTKLAYQYVYKNHSFKKYDKTRAEKKPRPLTDKPEMYDKERNIAAQTKGVRPLGSLRQIESYKNELKFKFPPIKDKHSTRKEQNVNMLGDKQYKDLKTESMTNVVSDNMSAFPNIENAMGVEIKYKYKQKEDDKGSLYSAPAGIIDDDQSTTSNIKALDMGQNLIQMKKFEQERLERRRELLAPPPSREEVRKDTWKRVLPPTPTRPSTVYPKNVKNDLQMRKMMKKEVYEVMDNWSTDTSRHDHVEKVKQLNNKTLKERPMPVIDRSRPTSAIFREFQEFKDRQNMTEPREREHSIIIRQLSPLPRAESSMTRRRNDYSSRVSSPTSKREMSPVPTHPRKLKRTSSEKFPSVSRTSSYREIPDDQLELHENALLTAFERIEIEKEKRKQTPYSDQDHDNKKNDISTKNEKPEKLRRKLPSTPALTTKQLSREKTKERMLEKGKTDFGPVLETSVLKTDPDIDMIQKVHTANVTEQREINTENTASEKTLREGRGLIPNPYQPLHMQLNALVEAKHEIPKNDDKERLAYVNSLSVTMLPTTRRGKKILYDHEHYSRTTPDSRKQLEMKAKAKRKLQLKNAKMAEERQSRQRNMDTGSNVGTERPPTRVSFNENVIVFQTI